MIEQLQTVPADASLVFKADGHDIQGDYHLTEFKVAQISSIDCGARVTEWTETSMQLLDGCGGEYMQVGKFLSIAEKSVNTLDGLGLAPLRAEFSPGNAGLRLFTLSAPEVVDSKVVVQMQEGRATCKPAADNDCCAPRQDTACCAPSQTSCCG